MRWTGDTSGGDWLLPRLGTWGSVTSLLPRDYEAYVRVLPPEPDGGVTPQVLAALTVPLTMATTTPEQITIGVWDGFGELHPDSGMVWVLAGLDTDAGELAKLQAAAEAEYKHEHRAALDPDVARAVERIDGRPGDDLLHLPHRDYVLLEGSLDELADPLWGCGAGIGWTSTGNGPMPQLIWPADHAWCLSAEIDDDSAVIGGSAHLVAAIRATPGIEVLPVGPDDRLVRDVQRAD